MLEISRSIYKGSKIAHSLQLLLQAIERPKIYRIVPFVKDFYTYRRLCRGSQDGVNNIPEFVQAGNGVERRSRSCETATGCNSKIVTDVFLQLLTENILS